MAQVFISYHHSSSNKLVSKMYDKLLNAGFEAWKDTKSISAGQDWRAEIDRAIRDSMALIVVLTPEAVLSQYVTYEWAFAMGVGVPVIPVLYKDIQDTDMHPRLSGVQRFDFRVGMNHPWDSLIELLHDLEADYNSNSIHVPRDAPQAIKRAVDALDSPNPEERKAAIRNLAQSDHPVAIEALICALRHISQDVRIYASSRLALVAANSKGAINADVQELLEALNDDTWEVRNAVIQVLGRIDNPAVVPALLKILEDDEYRVRLSAIEALGMIGEPSAVPSLLDALQDEEFQVRQFAARSLGWIGDPLAVNPLIGALDDENWLVCEAAAEALGAISDPAAVPALIECLQHKPWWNTDVAVRALKHIGTPDALAAVNQWPLPGNG